MLERRGEQQVRRIPLLDEQGTAQGASVDPVRMAGKQAGPAGSVDALVHHGIRLPGQWGEVSEAVRPVSSPEESSGVPPVPQERSVGPFQC